MIFLHYIHVQIHINTRLIISEGYKPKDVAMLKRCAVISQKAASDSCCKHIYICVHPPLV